MAEHDEWTAADDALVRRAMATLRSDVESVPLPDVRFVRARGKARRRHRFLALSAAAAVAVVVAGTVGYAAWGPASSRAPVTPASSGRTASTTSPATTATPAAVSPYLDTPGALPLGKEWRLALAWSSPFTVETPPNAEADLCWASASPMLNRVDIGDKVQDENLLSTSGNIQGRQTRWLATRSTAEQVATRQAYAIGRCKQGAFVVKPVRTTGWPRLYSYTAGDAGSGWYAVTLSGRQVAVLTVTEPDHPTTRFTSDQVDRLAEITTERLARYGGGTTKTATSTPDATGQKALDENMQVVGPGPLPASSLFVAASQWSSTALTGGAATNAGPGALEGSTAVASCETDQQQAGIGGRVGVVSIRVGTGSTDYIGRQRVQLDDSTGTDTQQAYVDARLAEAKKLFAKGCSTANATVKATPGPTPGTWRLDTVFKDGTATLSEWVGVTAQKTPGAVSTVVITKMADPKQGFAELDRLLNLARQK